MGELAITGGTRAKSKPFPAYPVIREKERAALLEVFESGCWAATNDKNEPAHKSYLNRLEKSMAEFHKQSYAVAVSSCTVALEMAVAALGIGAGDEVIVTSYSFVASATCILKAGALPVFADIEEDTWNISGESIKNCITERTKAIVVVHFAGQSADMDQILEIAKEHHLKIISDAAHALASQWDGLPIAKWSDITCFSFQHSKNISCGEGGLLVTEDPKLYQALYALHMVGRNLNSSWYIHDRLGSNLRMTQFQAAIAYTQFEDHLDYERIRNKNAEYLLAALPSINGLVPTKTVLKAQNRAYHLLCFSYQKEEWDLLSKKRFILALNAEGIPCHGGYEIPIYKNPLFDAYPDIKKEYLAEQNKNAEKISSQAIWLHQNLLLGDEQDIEEIKEAIYKIRKNYGELVRKNQ